MTLIVFVDSIVLLINYFAWTKDNNNLVKSVQEMEVIFTKYYINSVSKGLVVFHPTSKVAEVKGGPEKYKCPKVKSDTTFNKKKCTFSQKM